MQTQEEFIYYPTQQLLGFGTGKRWIMNAENTIAEMQTFLDANKGRYVFTCFSYDLKNKFEQLASENTDSIAFPLAILWSPEFVVDYNRGDGIFVQGEDEVVSRQEANYFYSKIKGNQPFKLAEKVAFNPRITKSEYVDSVQQIQAEIQYGNCYELNFCQEYYAMDVVSLDSSSLFRAMHNVMQAPFSVYFSLEDWSVMCFSPERYIQKTGSKLISQPIKGTIKRGENAEADLQLQETLLSDKKEISENVMITDLVRNDFSRIAEKGSVVVDKLCELQTFTTIHHLVSTISCEVSDGIPFTEILRATFPMGSMTGAPKIRVMELIEKHESFKRGLYAGSIGLIYPSGDFDLNVVIRSLLYNHQKEVLSCSVGSAITMKSDPLKEYEECLVKVNRILQFFA
jgi:para-aminobenzoate synthetase component 1